MSCQAVEAGLGPDEEYFVELTEEQLLVRQVGQRVAVDVKEPVDIAARLARTVGRSPKAWNKLRAFLRKPSL